MFPIKSFFTMLLFTLCLSSLGLAQEGEASEFDEQPAVPQVKVKSRPSTWSLGLSLLQWNEVLELRQGMTLENDAANFTGVIISGEKEFLFARWGATLGAFFGTGRAVGGGNTTVIEYQKDKVAYSMFGVSPRIFYRLSGRINAGLSGLIYSRNIQWPVDNPLIRVDSGRSLNALPMLDLNVRIFRSWDFYQGIGSYSNGSTMWRLGLHYRF